MLELEYEFDLLTFTFVSSFWFSIFFWISVSNSFFLYPSLLASLISSPRSMRMECCLLTVCALCAALLFVLFYWLVPAVQRSSLCTLIWHATITERLRDTLTRSTRPQVTCFVFIFDLHGDMTFKGLFFI